MKQKREQNKGSNEKGKNTYRRIKVYYLYMKFLSLVNLPSWK